MTKGIDKKLSLIKLITVQQYPDGHSGDPRTYNQEEIEGWLAATDQAERR
jgi:hypothetical protein